MMQIPNYVTPYMQIPSQQYATPAPNYNAVKIDVHNPSVSTPGVGQAVVNVPQQPQYAAPTMPYYTYPQAQLYSYPQTAQQPYYMPPQMQAPQAPQAPAPVAQAPQAPVEVPAPQVVQPAPQTVQPQVIQQNINTPQPAPEPVVTQQPAQAPKEAAKPVEIVPSAPLTPQVDLNAFIAKLTDPNYDVQASAMEEIANMVKDDPQKATELLDVKVMDALNNIVKHDSSSLEGPTPEQLAARKKKDEKQTLTPEEQKLADVPSPYEASERNKSYAMYTLAILQKLYGDEVAKLTNTTVPLTELPGAVTIVEQLKGNPNPMVRTSAVEALSYIQNPAYEKDLRTIFNNAKNDVDAEVQNAANVALGKLDAEAAGAKTAAMTPNPQPAQENGKTIEMTPNTQAPAQAA